MQWLHFAPYRGTWSYQYFLKKGVIEDGFIPWLQSGRYDDLPEDACFETEEFSFEQKRLCQLKSYLNTLCPLLILNEEKVRKICEEQDWGELFEYWKKHAPIDKFVNGTLPMKVEKGQTASLEEISSEAGDGESGEFLHHGIKMPDYEGASDDKAGSQVYKQ